MSQYTRSFRSSHTERPIQGDNSDNDLDQLITASRAWTIDSNEELDYLASSQAPPQSTRQAVPSARSSQAPPPSGPQTASFEPTPWAQAPPPSAPSEQSRTSRRSRRNSNESNPPVRIRFPSPASRNPAEGAATFKEYLQSDPTGPRLSREEATRMISQHLTYDELLHKERRSAYEKSVAAPSKTARSIRSESERKPAFAPAPQRPNVAYSESVYSSNAPPSAYGAGRVPLSGPSIVSGVSSWIDDVRDSVAGESSYARSTRRWRGEDVRSRR